MKSSGDSPGPFKSLKNEYLKYAKKINVEIKDAEIIDDQNGEN